jgi:sporulation protein YtfJ
MTTAMESIKEMVDVNTIVGDAVQSPDGSVIIPISRVSFGFAAGGGEYCNAFLAEEKEENDEKEICCQFPFAGGSGAGVSINPVAFMVVGNGQIKLLPVDINSAVDKILDLAPGIMQKIDDALTKKADSKKSAQPQSESTSTTIKEKIIIEGEE